LKERWRRSLFVILNARKGREGRGGKEEEEEEQQQQQQLEEEEEEEEEEEDVVPRKREDTRHLMAVMRRVLTLACASSHMC
jgi:hypothetical protein